MRFIYLLILALLPTPVHGINANDKHAVRYDTVWYDTTDYGDNCSLGAGTLPTTVPDPYKDIFIRAGAKHNVEPALVAAIFYAGEHGSSWPDPNGPWATSSANAQGPFQFLPATWSQYGDDGNGDGNKDIQNLSDAAFGAANYLAATGGTVGSPDGTPGRQPAEGPSIRSAIWHYNHADWYVEMVFSAYQQFLAGGAPSTRADCGGGLGINSDGFVFPLKTTKQAIYSGSDGPGGNAKWCYTSRSNCHHSNYNAADIHAPTNTAVVAARGGTVVPGSLHANPARLRIKGDDGLWYYYTHLLPGSITVNEGDRVEAGQTIGLIGTSGDAEGTAPHLHFDVSSVENGFSRPGVEATQYLIDSQPALLESFNALPNGT
jgi:peptidoglycan LD-endopeptidase LytH